MRRMAIMLVLAVACVSSESPVDVSLAVRVDPDPAMALWYAELEGCLGVEGRGFGLIRWYSTTGMEHPDFDVLAGLHIPPHDIHLIPAVWGLIRTPENDQVALLGRAIASHEMIHYITQKGWEVDHTDRYLDCDPARPEVVP